MNYWMHLSFVIRPTVGKKLYTWFGKRLTLWDFSDIFSYPSEFRNEILLQRSYLRRFAKFLLAALTYQTSASSWRSATTVFSIESATTHNMSGTAFCRTVQPYASQNYDLRPCQHDRQSPTNASHLMHCNFTTRILYKDAY